MIPTVIAVIAVGAIQLHKMFFLPPSYARVNVNPTIPNLAAA